MIDRPQYIPVRPIQWISSNVEARKYECRSLWEGYFNGTCIAVVMDYEYAAYGLFMGERLGASYTVEDAKSLVSYRFDKLSEKPEIKIIPPHVPGPFEKILGGLSAAEERHEAELKKKDH